MGLLKLVIDRQNRSLIALNGSVTAIPPLFQSNNQTLQISVADPTGSISTPYSLVDLGSSGLRVSIGQTPTGTAGGPTPLALQDTFVWNSAGKYFQADLALNTAAIDSYIGALDTRRAYFEVNVTLAGGRETIFQGQLDLRAVVDELASTVPSPVDQYLTKAEILAMFLKIVNDAGVTATFKSPGGIYGRELGVADDGSAIDNIITL